MYIITRDEGGFRFDQVNGQCPTWKPRGTNDPLFTDDLAALHISLTTIYSNPSQDLTKSIKKDCKADGPPGSPR